MRGGDECALGNIDVIEAQPGEGRVHIPEVAEPQPTGIVGQYSVALVHIIGSGGDGDQHLYYAAGWRGGGCEGAGGRPSRSRCRRAGRCGSRSRREGRCSRPGRYGIGCLHDTLGDDTEVSGRVECGQVIVRRDGVIIGAGRVADAAAGGGDQHPVHPLRGGRVGLPPVVGGGDRGGHKLVADVLTAGSDGEGGYENPGTLTKQVL